MYVQVFLQSILVRNVSSRVYSPVDCKLHCKKTKLCGHSLAQNQLACALAGHWPCASSVALQSSTPEKTPSSGQERLVGQDRRRKSENVSELWEKRIALMMGRALHNRLGSSRLRSLPVEPRKHWCWISWENHCLGSVQVSSTKGQTTKRARLAFYIYIYDFVYNILLGLSNLAVELEKDFHFDVLYCHV